MDNDMLMCECGSRHSPVHRLSTSASVLSQALPYQNFCWRVVWEVGSLLLAAL